MPTVSVIVPIYKVEKYLPECIDSILKQTFSDFELILVDDGSPDKCGEICDEYAEFDSRIRVFHKENGGVSSARNIGIDNARGYQIMFVDGDDTVEPDYIQNLLIQNNEDMVQGDCTILDNGFLKPQMTHDEIISDFGRYWNESGSFSSYGKCFNKSFLDKERLRFEEEFALSEDERFIIKCLALVSILRRTSSYGYNYRTDIPNTAVKKLWINRCELEQDFCERMEQLDSKDDFVFRFRWLRWHFAFNHLYHHLNVDKDKKTQIKKAIINAYDNQFFRESIPYIIRNGTLDEKIEARLMGYYKHKLYKPILLFVQKFSKLKNRG